jgi:hypothetical protein
LPYLKVRDLKFNFGGIIRKPTFDTKAAKSAGLKLIK